MRNEHVGYLCAPFQVPNGPLIWRFCYPRSDLMTGFTASAVIPTDDPRSRSNAGDLSLSGFSISAEPAALRRS
ncbi:hypothetical protein PAXRUDRAFT_826840 [Paxillus rubicundulus Ve08.2h10]|uniref:Uncharacterized protein n=1 Tax=Paxillus rubicundulus Ve08.2h10 TaxID=930991 RepID=A0A0D0E9A8_9AGAM|nr:hypothetical protein PAXRUDRAFT_826840 [Paxillus rubicundulus Ve08.2h10]